MITLKIVPIEWLDLLIVSLIGLAFLLKLEIASLALRINKIKKESSGAETEFKRLQEIKNIEITKINQLSNGRIKELTETIANLQSELTAKTNITHVDIPLDDVQVKILIFLGEHGENKFPITAFMETFSLSYPQAKYQIDELLKFHLLDSDETYTGEPPVYYLNPKGTEFLAKNKIL